jgi:DNA-directed RNA polymerase I subunit RPA12
MSAIGSLLFCTDCGNLLDENRTNEVAKTACDVCGVMNLSMLTIPVANFG